MKFIYFQNPALEPFPIGYKRNERRRRPAAEVEENPTAFMRGTFEMADTMARLRCHSVISKV